MVCIDLDDVCGSRNNHVYQNPREAFKRFIYSGLDENSVYNLLCGEPVPLGGPVEALRTYIEDGDEEGIREVIGWVIDAQEAIEEAVLERLNKQVSLPYMKSDNKKDYDNWLRLEFEERSARRANLDQAEYLTTLKVGMIDSVYRVLCDSQFNPNGEVSRFSPWTQGALSDIKDFKSIYDGYERRKNGDNPADPMFDGLQWRDKTRIDTILVSHTRAIPGLGEDNSPIGLYVKAERERDRQRIELVDKIIEAGKPERDTRIAKYREEHPEKAGLPDGALAFLSLVREP